MSYIYIYINVYIYTLPLRCHPSALNNGYYIGLMKQETDAAPRKSQQLRGTLDGEVKNLHRKQLFNA